MTHPTYVLIGTKSTRAARVLWMLEELGLPYDHVAASPRSAGVVEANPAGKVPVLLVDNVPITDSTAIVQFLADRHGALTHKAGTLQRAQQDSLTQFLLDEFDAALWVAARHSFILPPELRQPAIKESLKWELAQSQKTLARRLGDGPFLMGEQMTVPDIIAGHCGLWAANIRFPAPESSVAAYFARLQARPAFQRAVAA